MPCCSARFQPVPWPFLGCLAVCLQPKGLGLDRMGEIGGLLALGALGKSVLGYQYADGVLTFEIPGPGNETPAFPRCLGLAAAVVLPPASGKGLSQSGLEPGTVLRHPGSWLSWSCYTAMTGAHTTPARDCLNCCTATRRPPAPSNPAHGRGTASFGRRTGYLPVSFQPNFYARAALRSDPADQRRRRALRISEPVGQYRAAQHAPVRGAAGLGPAYWLSKHLRPGTLPLFLPALG